MKKIILFLTLCLLFLAGSSYAQIGYDGKRVTPRSPVGDIMHYPAAGFPISTGYAWGTSIPRATVMTTPTVIVAKPDGTADESSTSDNICHHITDSAGTDSYVGMTIYNITNSTNCTVTANDDVSITCAAGSTMSWYNTDVYRLGPGPDQSGSFFYVGGAGTLQWPTTVGYSTCVMAEGTVALKIDFGASVVFTGVLNAAVESTSAGDYIAASGSTTDDFMCLHNKTTTVVKGLGKRGTWTQE